MLRPESTAPSSPTSRRIHATAIVDPRAELGESVEIGPYCVVGADVQIGRATRLVSHVVIEGPCVLGERNVLYPFSVVGIAPQHKRDQGAASRLVMGDDNTVREHVTLHRGTGEGTTRIGSRNLLMVGCHVAHDVTLGSDIVLANSVQLAGHAVIEDWVTFGGLSGVAQFVRVGQSAFVAAASVCERDVPPFVIVQGDRARVRSINVVGLERRGVPAASIAQLRRAVARLFTSRTGSFDEALRGLDRSDPYVDLFARALGADALASSTKKS